MTSSNAQGEVKPETYPSGYVEDSVELRTKLGDRFPILLQAEKSHHAQAHEEIIDGMG